MTLRYSLIFAMFMMLLSEAHAADEKTGGIWLDDLSVSPLSLPKRGDIESLLAEFEYSKNDTPIGIQFDINGDGIEDTFLRSMPGSCGTGGCPYALINGKTKKRIGDFFGSPIIVLDKILNRFPVIYSYSHMSAISGNFVVYVFDGKKYQIVSDVYLLDESVKALFENFAKFRKIEAKKPE